MVTSQPVTLCTLGCRHVSSVLAVYFSGHIYVQRIWTAYEGSARGTVFRVKYCGSSIKPNLKWKLPFQTDLLEKSGKYGGVNDTRVIWIICIRSPESWLKQVRNPTLNTRNFRPHPQHFSICVANSENVPRGLFFISPALVVRRYRFAHALFFLLEGKFPPHLLEAI